jgi:formylglycine-generating enzyme required for sulfatase activity
VHPELEAAAAPENPLVLVPAGVACLGKRPDSCTYGWDNEFGEYRLQVPKFEASKYQVTNAEFLEFVKAGGYQEEALWASEGWKW